MFRRASWTAWCRSLQVAVPAPEIPTGEAELHHVVRLDSGEGVQSVPQPATNLGASLLDTAQRDMRPSLRRALITAALIVMGTLAACAPFDRGEGGGPTRAEAPQISGRVVALDGRPVSGARMEVGDRKTRTDARGRFSVDAAVPSWVTVRDRRYLRRTRPGFPGAPLLIRLTPDDGETVSMTFGGDVMFGRRFFEAPEDDPARPPLLSTAAGVGAHLKLLQGVRPLLEEPDVAAVNLETPLVRRPSYRGRRPARFHPTKAFAFASLPAAARALDAAGVDIVDLGNNHLFDALESGVDQTLRFLQRAGFASSEGYFGAGRSAADAGRPATVRRRGQSIAFVGCTSIEGRDQPISYVAEGAKGGAAACEERQLASEVGRASRSHDAVVAMIHGGNEYERRPSKHVRRLSDAARRAGATLVINHHPHVVGGLNSQERSLTAFTLGNLVFDQRAWPTFQSYLLTVHLRRGRVVRAYAEPLRIDAFTPAPIGGDEAVHVAREAAGREPGQPVVIENGAAEVDTGGRARQATRRVALDGRPGQGEIYRLMDESRVGALADPDAAQFGRDLLWVGGFEDLELERGDRPAELWDLGAGGSVGPQSARSGALGARVERAASDRRAAVIAPRHRMLLEGGRDVSAVGAVRTARGGRVRLQLSMYDDTRGSSVTRKVVTLPARSRWEAFRVDARVPRGTVAIGLFVKVQPSPGQRTSADLDDLRVVEWKPSGTPAGPLYDYLRVTRPTTALMVHPYLPGGDAVPPLRPERLAPARPQR